MRISDWSSDVCSSDLENQCLPHPLPFGESLYRKVGMQRGVAAISKQRDHQHLANAHANAALLIHQEPGQYSQYESDCRDRAAVQQNIGHPLGRKDRKSVMKGTSVSVRVDPGGRRISKK